MVEFLNSDGLLPSQIVRARIRIGLGVGTEVDYALDRLWNWFLWGS